VTVRWKSRRGRPSLRVESAKVDAFLADVLQVCLRHELALSHEDCHGGFVVEDWESMTERGIMGSYSSWLWEATIGDTVRIQDTVVKGEEEG